jgi:periplasmic protein CpxP/Spy
MKLTILILSLTFALIGSAFAQPQGGNRPGGGNWEEMQKQQMETMKTELKLTPDQITKVEALNAETNKKTKAIRDANSTDREANREKMRAVREEQDKKLKTILTKEQATKWDEIQEKRRAERRANNPNATQRQGERGGQRGGAK